MAFCVAQKHLRLVRQLSAWTQAVPRLDMVLLAIDLEWHESGRHELLEIGLSLTLQSQWHEAHPPISTYHLVVQDFYDVRNGTHVPDHKDDFNFGPSELTAYEDLRHRIRNVIKSVAPSSHEIVLIGHSIDHDLAVFERIGMADMINHEAANILDIALAYQAQQNERQTTKLSRILDHYNIPYENLHNAANDAYYTLVACHRIAMAER
ncbi:hypothetical protein KCU78_g168, partial [Aureobasidium melanogenum]